MITDIYSRKIVGYDINDSMEINGCTRALNKAIYQAGSIKYAKTAAKKVINLYNNLRLHLPLDFKTPNMVYKNTA